MCLRLGNTKPNVEYHDLYQRANHFNQSQLTPTKVAEMVVAIRRRKLPDIRSHPNVGSVFKNPVIKTELAQELSSTLGLPSYPTQEGTKVSAAFLIDHAGWKGYEEHGICVWHRQPLVLVHRSGVSNARHFLALTKKIQQDVRSKFEIDLELEPIVLGTD